MASEPSSEVEELEDDLEIPVPEPEWKRPRVSVLRKPAGKFGECEHGLFLTKCVKCHGCPHGGLRSFCQTCKSRGTGAAPGGANRADCTHGLGAREFGGRRAGRLPGGGPDPRAGAEAKGECPAEAGRKPGAVRARVLLD
ncbi:unnamed protein product [Effrenium voratum]|uniref:Uncharacterized protein n=1 Tax=Effrenium voratum TaxID=2562239 RepID=A0AA36NEM4_9DINO|nr:unnamed protein product [Effrenium voratum]